MSLDPVSAGFDLIKSAIERVFPDKTQAAAITAEVEKARDSGELQLALAQIAVNAEDAKSGSKFQSWWRPYLAWWCVNAFAYHFVIFPIVSGFFPALKDIDQVSVGVLSTVLMTLIGARSWEKTKGVDTK